MRIAIRMDDITPDMDWAKFQRFKEILDKHGVKPLIGVVPDNKDRKLQIQTPRKDYWEYLKRLEKDGWVIAMHGFNHLYTTRKGGIFPLNKKSEFAGLSLSEQDKMIREGKRLLRTNGINTDFFMAPSHSYDRNTLAALKKNGFTKITDGFGRAPYEMSGITFYPISISKSKSIGDTSDGTVTFVYHANTMTDKDFEAFEKLFDKATVVSYSENLALKAKKQTLADELTEYLTATAKYYAVKLRKLIK